MKKLLLLLLITSGLTTYSQPAPLTVEKIMRDPKWMGTSPSNAYWTADGKYLLFSWNPEKAVSDSIYYISPSSLQPQKSNAAFRLAAIAENKIHYNSSNTVYVYATSGDIFMTNVKTGITHRITQTTDIESNPQFSFNDNKIIYTRDQNAYAWDVATGITTQLTNFQSVKAPVVNRTSNNQQEKWLHQEALENSLVLERRKEKKDLADSMLKTYVKDKTLRVVNIEGKNLSALTASHDGRFITYRLTTMAAPKNTIVPDYVTEVGFT